MNAYPTSVYSDFQGLAALKYQAREDQAGSLDKVAKQFESLFVQMMLKQMRQASFGNGIFDSDRTRHYQEMYDKQIALHLADKGMGMGEVLKRQLGKDQDQARIMLSGLERYRENPTLSVSRNQANRLETPVTRPQRSEANANDTSPVLDSPQQFVRSLWTAAERTASRIGLPAEALLAQAALETGWGGHVMPDANGTSSHNLFGIKADQRWQGDEVRRDTLEYEDGIAVRRRERFRSYQSYEESFEDYVAFLQSNPRYAEALANTHDSKAYFNALQQAGYATDPRYAEKILRVMQGPEMQVAVREVKNLENRSI